MQLVRLVGLGLGILMFALVVSGCETGSVSGTQRSCTSSGGLFGSGEIRCTGSAATVSGSPTLEVTDEVQSGGEYELDLKLRLERGEARAYVVTTDDEEVGGEVSPENPLRITGVVDPMRDEEVVVHLQVHGEEEVEGLSYEAALVPVD